MDPLPTAVRLVWTAMFILGCLSSGLVILFTIFRVARHQRNNIYFVRLLAISEFAAGVFGWLSMPRMIPTYNRIAFLSYGVCTSIGPRFCYVCTISMLQCLAVAGSIVPLTFIIRYISLRWGPPSYQSLILVTMLLLAINGVSVIAMATIYSPPDTWFSLVSLGKVDEETYNNYDLFGPENIFSWQCQLFMTLLVPMGFVSSSVSFTFRFLILRFLKQASTSKLSPSTRAMQRKFVKMLTIQATVPIIGVFPSTAYTLLKHGVTSSHILQAGALLFDAVFPFLSGATILFFLSDYRKFIVKKLCGKQRQQTTSTGLVDSRL